MGEDGLGVVALRMDAHQRSDPHDVGAVAPDGPGRVGEAARLLLESRVDFRVGPEQLQRRQSCRRGDRIAGERSRLVDLSVRRHVAHDVLASPVNRRRHAAAHDLAKRRQVGNDAVIPLGTRKSKSKARDHLVENQQRPDLCGQVAEHLQKTRCGQDNTHVRRHRLDHDGRQPIPPFRKDALHRFGVVVRNDDCVLRIIRRDAGAIGLRSCQKPGPGLHEESVGMSVIAAFELKDVVASREAAGDTDRAHHGLGAGTDHAAHFHRGDKLADEFRHLDLARGRGPVGESRVAGGLHRLKHLRMRMPEDAGSPRTDVVDVLVAVDVDKAVPVRTVDEPREAANH